MVFAPLALTFPACQPAIPSILLKMLPGLCKLRNSVVMIILFHCQDLIITPLTRLPTVVSRYELVIGDL